MPTDYGQYVPKEIKKTRQEAGRLGQKASALGAGAFTFPERLREALNKKLNYNKDLIMQQAQAESEYFATPAKARAKYVKQPGEAGYITPIQAESLVAQERAQARVPWQTTTGVLQERMGRTEDIIGAGTAAYQAQVMAAQGAAQIAQQAYQQLLQEYTTGAGIQQQEFNQQFQQQQAEFQRQQWEEQQRQWEEQMRMRQEEARRQQEQFEWEQSWQEKLWEHELAKPYYKPTAGGGTSDIQLPAVPIGGDSFGDMEADWGLFNVKEETPKNVPSAGMSIWNPPAYPALQGSQWWQ